jgi:hypothetical protein
MNRYAELKGSKTTNNDLRNVGTTYKDVAKYPTVPLNESDIYVITEWGDRFESLAFQFYGDVTLWWIISIANPNIVKFSSIFIPIGSQIRIPQNISSVIDSYNELNR